MSFWSTVDEQIGKGKGDKAVKIVANELSNYRQQKDDEISKLQGQIKENESKIADLTELQKKTEEEMEATKSDLESKISN